MEKESGNSPRPLSTPGTTILEGPVIDRLSPTLRPRGLAVMRQSWRDLMFLHWACEPDAIRRLIPPGLDLDLFEGRAFVGLVPFTMKGVRPSGFPSVPRLSSFHETNVRTYVHHSGREPGVWFFSLDAAYPVAVRLARKLFHLPYHDARMFLEREVRNDQRSEPDGAIVYAGVRRSLGPLPASYLIRGSVSGPVEPAVPGTLEHFLAERYYLYCRRSSRIYRGQVHHAPYPLRKARVLSLDENLLAAAGIDRPTGAPLAHYAEGVDVEVFRLRMVCPA
jgi:uncharacterized protein YqjF (DUF2071 family)